MALLEAGQERPVPSPSIVPLRVCPQGNSEGWLSPQEQAPAGTLSSADEAAPQPFVMASSGEVHLPNHSWDFIPRLFIPILPYPCRGLCKMLLVPPAEAHPTFLYCSCWGL